MRSRGMHLLPLTKEWGQTVEKEFRLLDRQARRGTYGRAGTENLRQKSRRRHACGRPLPLLRGTGQGYRVNQMCKRCEASVTPTGEVKF